MQEATRGFRYLVLIEPPLALGLAFVVSIFLGIGGFLGTAWLVESDPVGGMLGMERKLDVRLVQGEADEAPPLEETRSAVASVFDAADVLVVPDGDDGWQLLAWIPGDPTAETITDLTGLLAGLGWVDAVPMLTSQPRYIGAMENPKRMRLYIPPAMTIQAFVFILAAWAMVRWRKPAMFRDAERPAAIAVWGAGAALVAFAGSTLIGGGLQLTGWEVEEQAWIRALMADRPALLSLMPWLVLIGPVSEEVFFRGYVFRRLFSSAGPRAAYLVSAFLFALIHWHPVGFPMYALIGLIFCWVYQRTGSLWAPVVGHVIYNGLVITIPLLAPAP